MALSAEQRAALAHVCEPGRLVCLQGDAGTGKSLLLGAAREAWVKAGYEVKGAALSAKAAQGLERLRALAPGCPVPIYGIGGVSAANAAEVLRAGAHGVAVGSAVLDAPDPERAAHELVQAVADAASEVT